MSNINVMRKNLGPVTAYKYAVQQGYTGTEQEFAALMASYATVAEEAEAAKDDAIDAKTAAEEAQAAAEAAAEQAEGAIEVDETLSVKGRAADAKVTGDRINNVQANLSDISDVVFTDKINLLDWKTLSAASRPTGWINGFYASSTGKYNESALSYMSTKTGLKGWLNGFDTFTITPPTGYAATVTGFATPYSQGHVIAYRLNGEVDQTLEVPIDHDLYYYFTIGKFDNLDVEDYLTDAFTATILLKTIQKTVASEDLHTFNFGMFSKIGVCGYSWDAGFFHTTKQQAGYTRRDLSWIANVAKRNGIEYGCYAVVGGTSIAPNSTYTTTCWQSDSNGLPALLNDSVCDLYIMHMFGNDLVKLGADYIGTISDINDDYHDNPDTYYGNYGRILDQIKEHAPDALIILTYNPYDNADYTAYMTAILAIADHYGLPVINWYDDEWYATQMNKYLISEHPTVASYSAMSMSMERLFGKCVEANWDYFRDVVPN